MIESQVLPKGSRDGEQVLLTSTNKKPVCAEGQVTPALCLVIIDPSFQPVAFKTVLFPPQDLVTSEPGACPFLTLLCPQQSEHTAFYK